MIRKIYRERIKTTWEIVEKETVDEIIFRTTKQRDRLILELMARGGMRIGEVLKLTERCRGSKAVATRTQIRQRA
jgi:integrase/recombinase XerD